MTQLAAATPPHTLAAAVGADDRGAEITWRTIHASSGYRAGVGTVCALPAHLL